MATIASKSVKTINVLIAVSAVLAITTEALGQSSAYMLLKPLTTILVTSLVVLVRQTQQSKFKTLMVLAFLFCLLGDILLLFPAYFVYGLAAFLVAHLLFATSFVQLKGFQTHWISFLALYGIGISLFLWLKPGLGDFMVPVGVYVLVICFMAWQGIGLFLKEKSKPFVWIAVAVLLFMFSDTMIAIAKFKADFDYSSIVILSTYWLSIGLIANAARRIILSPQS
ncbi:lysoplasmalogenase [Flagellimonas sp.]|uniref:lysoplasmalogenase n=1 Tax=Flagellimonas sp. TaxID=2058762 RepID=UPI003BAB290D